MNRTRSASLLLCSLLLTAPAFAQSTASAQTTSQAPSAWSADNTRTMQQSVEATATITAIDKATRKVTLKSEDGTTTDIVAGDDVKRFDELAIGDKVHARYTIGVTTELRAPTEAEKADPFVVVEGGARAPTDAAPAAGAGRMIRVVATIEAIDRTANTVTLKGPKGNSMIVDVTDPAVLEKPKVGDTVVVTIAESVALSLEKVAAKPAKAKPAKKK
jgi:Cu/Ag efflux protein CusF